MMKFKLLLLLCLVGVLNAFGDQKQDSLIAKSAKDTADAREKKLAGSIPLIRGILTQRPEASKIERNGAAKAGDVIRVQIIHLQQFLESKPQDKSKLLLFIDGLPFAGVYSTNFDQYSKLDIKNKAYRLSDTATIPFILLRNLDSKPTWDYLYHKTGLFDSGIAVEISIGWEGMFPLSLQSGADNRIRINFFNPYILEGLIVLYLAFISFFIFIACTTDVLRDNLILSSPPAEGPYSLAQTQLGFWTVLVVGGFFYTLALTDIANSLNTSILLLLGITVTTSGTASYIDYYKKKNPPAGFVAPKGTSNFIKDILSDGTTYSVQRVQIAVWTLVIGLYFIYYTINNKSMPIIPDTLLYLTGVSSLAYVVNKGTEKP